MLSRLRSSVCSHSGSVLQIDNKTQLHTAAAEGQLSTLRELLANDDIPVDIADKWGFNALHRASERGQTECVEFLLQKGSQCRRHSKWCEYTPLILAAENGHRDCVRVLLEAGSDPSEADTFGNTALHKAVSYNHVECVRALVNHGADVNVTNKYNVSGLHISARNGYLKVLKILLSDPSSNTNMRDIDGATPLYHACSWGYLECSALLLDKGALIDLGAGVPDTSPFKQAMSRGQFRICALLLAAEFKVKMPMKNITVEPWTSMVTVSKKALAGPRAQDIHQFLVLLLCRHMRSIHIQYASRARSQNSQTIDTEMELCSWLVRGVDMAKLSIIYGEELLVDLAFNWRCGELLRCIFEAGHCFDPIYLIARVADSVWEIEFKKTARALRAKMDTARSLKSLCRLSVRRQLGHVMQKAEQLPLPKSLIIYLINL